MPVQIFYKPGKAPDAQEKEPKELGLFLERELGAIADSFSEHYYIKYQELHVAPERPRDGMTVYADGTNWNPGSGEGVYVYVAGAWVAAGVAATVAAAKPAFSAYKSADQTGVADGVYTTVTFNIEIYDIGSWFAANAWTPPAGLVTMSAGLYAIGTGVSYGSVGIAKNGGILKRQFDYPISGNQTMGNISVMDRCSGSDVYTVQGMMEVSSGTVTFNSISDITYFQGAWLGP